YIATLGVEVLPLGFHTNHGRPGEISSPRFQNTQFLERVREGIPIVLCGSKVNLKELKVKTGSVTSLGKKNLQSRFVRRITLGPKGSLLSLLLQQECFPLSRHHLTFVLSCQVIQGIHPKRWN
ncbi:hypothetical protein PSTG_14789, partial [Puccinia striiformis f. sp. tritici PST-78]